MLKNNANKMTALILVLILMIGTLAGCSTSSPAARSQSIRLRTWAAISTLD